jgi:DNA-binding CsgD family transcriptional regulator
MLPWPLIHQSSIFNPMQIHIDQPRKEIAIALARAGMTGYWIAAFMGCDENTLRDALANDEMFRLRHLQARAEKQMELLGTIAQAATKSWRASVWLLERLYPKEYNLRKSQNELQLDAFGLTIETNANQSEAPARTDERDAASVKSPPPPSTPKSKIPTIDSNPLCQFLDTRHARTNHNHSPPEDLFPDAFHVPINIAPVPQ